MKKITVLIITVLISSYVYAIGEWNIFPSASQYRRGEYFAGKIFLLSGNTLISVDAEQKDNIQQHNRISGLNGTSIFDIALSESANKLAIVYYDGNIDFINNDGSITNLPDYANKVIVGDRTIKSISERDGKLYISTGFGFMIVNIERVEFEDTFYYDISEYKDGSYSTNISTVSQELLNELNSSITINGVASSSNAFLSYINGYLFTSNVESDFRNCLYDLPGIVSIYDTYEDTWKNIYSRDVNPLTDGTTWFQGTTCLGVDPNDIHHYYVGTFALGIFEFRDDKLYKCYNYLNDENLESIIPDTYTTRISSINVDQQGYTWFINAGVENTLRCITPSGNIIKYPTKDYEIIWNAFDRLLITKNNPYLFKWILAIRPWGSPRGMIYYDGGTPENLEDDEYVMFTSITDQDNNVYSPKYFTDIAEDKNGAIWLLSSSGPFVIDSQIEAFKNPGKVRRIKIPRNDGTNLADYLLANVECNCIAIDANNRKWIGTKEAGLYLLSADGLSMIEHFTTENSPIPSNEIIALAYDETSGTVYISCEDGILSYTTDAVKGEDNYSNVACYPNPVRPEYSGPIHITGLKENTKVRICDITNTIVYSTQSVGGSISWDLLDESGQRVKSGVYVVYGIDTNGKGGVVTKFMVI